MASKALSSITLFLCFNLVFFTVVSSHNVPCHCGESPSHGGQHGGNPPMSPTPHTPQSPSHGGQHGGNPPMSPPPRTPQSPSHGGQHGGNPPISVAPPSKEKCPIDILKLGVCANVLNGLLGVTIGTSPKQPCCSLVQGLADLDAAVCLCTALKANVLGIHLNVPISLRLLLNACGCNYPSGFTCP